MKIALFQHVTQQYDTIFIHRGDNWSPLSDYIQISEWVEVTLPPLQNASELSQQLATLDRERQSTEQRFSKEIARIDERKSTLLAQARVV